MSFFSTFKRSVSLTVVFGAVLKRDFPAKSGFILKPATGGVSAGEVFVVVTAGVFSLSTIDCEADVAVFIAFSTGSPSEAGCSSLTLIFFLTLHLRKGM